VLYRRETAGKIAKKGERAVCRVCVRRERKIERKEKTGSNGRWGREREGDGGTASETETKFLE